MKHSSQSLSGYHLFLLAAVVAAAVLSSAYTLTDEASATGGPCGNNTEWSISDDHTVLTISLIDPTKSGTIDYYDDLSHLPPWHDYAGSITTINLPENLGRIGTYAFLDCDKVASITIPKSISYFTSHTFRNCSSLTEFVFEEGNTDLSFVDGVVQHTYGHGDVQLELVPPGQFRDTRELTLDWDNLDKINEQALQDTVYLEKLTISNAKDGSLDIAYDQNGHGAFENNTSIVEITFSSNITYIKPHGSPFKGCTNLTRFITSEDCTMDLNACDQMFSGCTSLSDVRIYKADEGYGSESFPSKCFDGCTSLKSFVFPTGLFSTGDDVFSGCTELESVTLPEGYQQIDSRFLSTSPKVTGLVLPSTVKYLEFESFMNSMITSVDLPDGVSYIDSESFKGCTGLVSVRVPGDCVHEDSIFMGCSSLKSVCIKDAKTIGPYVFQGCRTLESIEFGSQLTEIGSYAFQNCRALITPEFPESLRTIRSSQFQNCYALQNVVLPDAVAVIENYAFNRCEAIQNIGFGTGLTNVYANAFPTLALYSDGDRIECSAENLKGRTFVGSGTDKRLDDAAYGFSIAFDAGEGVSTSGLMTTTGGKLPSLPNAVYGDHTFYGWSRTGSCGDLVTTDTVFDGPCTLVAVWEQQYMVKFLDYDGSILEQKLFAAGTVPSCSVTPARPPTDTEVYVFEGWNPSPAAVTADASYTAVYRAEEIKVEGDKAVMDASDCDSVVITKDVLDKVSGVSTLEVILSEASFSMDRGVIDGIAAGTTLTVSDQDRGRLTPELQKLVGDRPMLDIALGSVTDLGGTMRISIPYSGSESADGLAVYCIRDDGTYETFKASFVDGAVTFETSHLSCYAVGIVKSGQGSGNIVLWAAVCAAIVAVACIGIVFFRRGRA